MMVAVAMAALAAALIGSDGSGGSIAEVHCCSGGSGSCNFK